MGGGGSKHGVSPPDRSSQRKELDKERKGADKNLGICLLLLV